MKLKLVIEKGDDELFGSVEAPGIFIATVGQNLEEVQANIQGLIADYLEHEGAEAPEWAGQTATSVEFEIEYDLTV